MSHWSHLHELFWSSLAVHLAWDPMTIDQRELALHWLGEVAAAQERGQQRQEIVRALEDGILKTLEMVKEEGFTVEECRGSVIQLLLPLMEGRLLEDMDPPLRRCLGHILALPERGRASKMLSGSLGEEGIFQLKISEEEEEQAAIAAVRDARQGHPSPGVTFGPSSIRLTLVKEVASVSQKIQMPVRISLLNLVLADDNEIQPYLLDHLTQYFTVVDPSLAQKLKNLQGLLMSADPAIRQDGLQSLCFAYLSSSYFSLRRDFGHGLRRLSDRPLAELDVLCGLASLPEGSNFADLLQAVLSADNSLAPSIPSSTRHALFLLRLNSPEILPLIADRWFTELSRLEAEGRSRLEILGVIAKNACYRTNIFESLWSFVTLLLAEHHHRAGSLEFLGQRLPVAEWVRAYLVYMLQASSRDDRAATLGEPFTSLWRGDLEIQRRQVHAHTMRLAVWIAASQRHVRELAAKVQGGDEVIGGWLIRSLLLTDRLLPIITHDLYSSPEEMQRALGEIAIRLGIAINPELYPDLFNPFLYGPAEYDHSLAALLAILNVTWEHLARIGQDQAAPYWWSEAVHDALATVAAQPETEAETMLRRSRTQGKPNRLGVILDRTPQELAGEILRRGTVQG